MPKWVSLFLRGCVTITLTWAFTGCRVGSQVVEPNDPDHISGYYVTQPQTVTFYVTTTDTFQKSAPISLLPSEVGQSMTNPLALRMQDLTSGLAVMTPPEVRRGLPIFVNPDFSLSYLGSTSYQTYWLDPNCQNFEELTETGKVDKSARVTAPAGKPYPISGSLQVKIQVVNQFRGNCQPTFQALSSCYQDALQCGGSSSSENTQLQAKVIATFSPFIQTQLITVQDIAKIVNFAYEVSYE